MTAGIWMMLVSAVLFAACMIFCHAVKPGDIKAFWVDRIADFMMACIAVFIVGALVAVTR